jgi:hypothetical protein
MVLITNKSLLNTSVDQVYDPISDHSGNHANSVYIDLIITMWILYNKYVLFIIRNWIVVIILFL